MSSTFGFFLHVVNCLILWMSLFRVWKLFILIRYAATCQTIIWNFMWSLWDFAEDHHSVCLSVNRICSWSKVILIALALWPLLYQNLLIMSFKVSHSHDYFGSLWSVRCILWLKCGLWPWGFGIHVTCSCVCVLVVRKAYHEFCVVVNYILNINILSV